MRLKDYITKELVFVIHGPAYKHAFLRQFVSCIKKIMPAIDEEELLGGLMEREEQISTGIGHGVAVPHAIVKSLDRIVCVIAQSPEGVEFQALDASPVHVVFMLMSPPDKRGEHLRLLARIARLVSNQEFVSRIATAKDAETVFAVTMDEDGRHV